MTIKWGDPIECNGVRPDWLRGRQPLSVDTGIDCGWLDYGPDEINPVEDWSWSHSDGAPCIRRFRLPAGHPAYVALTRGFTPWSGGDSAPDDWDATQPVLFRDRFAHTGAAWHWGHCDTAHPRDIIGYRKRNTRFDDPHLARIEVEGSAPVEGVFIKRMTEAEMLDRFGLSESTTPGRKTTTRILRELGLLLGDGCGPTEQPDYVRIVPFTRAEWDAVPDHTAWAQSVGLIRPETTAERFTRETGHAVTEAVEAALNWKDTQA